MARRQPLLVIGIILFSFFLSFTFIFRFRNAAQGTRDPLYGHSAGGVNGDHAPAAQAHLFHGEASAPKLENATLKAELGRSSWHLLHTLVAKFPESPDQSDSDSLKAYLYLLARLYPCGDCARHFQGIMAKYPPQVTSRKAASTWACFVHNEVNLSLGKDQFDCGRIGDFYDCGCGSEGEKGGEKGKKEDKVVKKGEDYKALALEKEEGLTRGG